VADRPIAGRRRLAGQGHYLDDLLGAEGGRGAGAGRVVKGVGDEVGQQSGVVASGHRRL
jgi:hypothetical protein